VEMTPLKNFTHTPFQAETPGSLFPLFPSVNCLSRFAPALATWAVGGKSRVLKINAKK